MEVFFLFLSLFLFHVIVMLFLKITIISPLFSTRHYLIFRMFFYNECFDRFNVMLMTMVLETVIDCVM